MRPTIYYLQCWLSNYRVEDYLRRYYQTGCQLKQPQGKQARSYMFFFHLANLIMCLISLGQFGVTVTGYKTEWFACVTMDFLGYGGFPTAHYLAMFAFWLMSSFFYHVHYVVIFQLGIDRFVRLLIEQDDAILLGGGSMFTLKSDSRRRFVFFTILNHINFLFLQIIFLTFPEQIFSLGLSYGNLFLSVGLFLTTLLSLNVASWLSVHLGIHSGLIFGYLIRILLIRIAQSVKYLQNNDCEQLKLRLLNFRRQTLTTLDYLTLFDTVLGTLFTVYIVVICPMNATLVITIFYGRSSVLTLDQIIFLNFALGQLCGLVQTHVLLAKVSRQLHQPFRKFISRYIQLHKCSFRMRLKLANFIFAFHTERRYGFTYSSFGLITMFAFAKFLFIYSKFLMFNYKRLAFS